MKKIQSILLCAAAGMLALSSCSKTSEFVGSWQAMEPTDISSQLPSAAYGSMSNSVTFGPDTINGAGEFVLTSLIDITQPVVENPGIDAAYEVSVAATASINGTWTYAKGEDDELIVTLDPTSLSVNIDNNGVTFRQNVVTEAEQPVTDSLTNVTVNLWKEQLAPVAKKEFYRYQRLDDVKLKDKTTLKLEVENPEQDLYFRKM